ncbi:hypothetical protein ACWGLE_16015 [Streptomyces sp. NPDC055897]
MTRGGKPIEDLALVLTAEETAAFHVELGDVLYPSPPAEGAAS